MRVFVDTSAIMTLLDRSDPRLGSAKQVWSMLLEQDAALFTTNYTLLEMVTLVQRRLGMDAARDLAESIVPLFSIVWVDENTHREGMAALLLANRRRLSLVDCVTFLVCRRLAVDTVFAFDSHFEEQGFRVLPSQNSSS